MPGAFTRARAQRLASGDYSQPSWELAMARKDAMIERGHAHDDWTVIAKDHVG